MEFRYIIFYACQRLRFLDVETNPGPRRPVPTVCRLLCSNVRGLAGNLSDLTVASSRNDVLFCRISMAQAVLNLRVIRKVFLKHQVNWNTVCGSMQDLPWRNIWSADNPAWF